MLKLLAVVIVFVAFAFVLLGINVLIFKRRFPETEIGNNKNMMKLGLTCPRCEEKRAHKRFLKPVSLNGAKLRPDWENIQK